MPVRKLGEGVTKSVQKKGLREEEVEGVEVRRVGEGLNSDLTALRRVKVSKDGTARRKRVGISKARREQKPKFLQKDGLKNLMYQK